MGDTCRLCQIGVTGYSVIKDPAHCAFGMHYYCWMMHPLLWTDQYLGFNRMEENIFQDLIRQVQKEADETLNKYFARCATYRRDQYPLLVSGEDTKWNRFCEELNKFKIAVFMTEPA